MLNKKQIESEINGVTTLRNLTEAYGEIAASRMKKVRGFVLRNRDYLASINSIFKDTLSSYSNMLSQMVKEGKVKEGGRVTFLAHNGKTVAVLVSANTGFYGSVVKSTFNKFISDIKNEDIETTIIGKAGRNMFLSKEPNKPYTYFDLPDYGVDSGKLAEVIKHLVQYEKINVYYGKYVSVVTQKAESEVIEAGTHATENPEGKPVSFLFEPSIENILMFFETQIFASLFDQVIRESQLAKFASRILAMDNATLNIDKKLDELKKINLKTIHDMANKKQLDTLISTIY